MKRFILGVTVLILLAGCVHQRCGNGSCKEMWNQSPEEFFINPREVELKITYHIQGIQPGNSKLVTMQEFSEEPVSWNMEKEVKEPVLLLYVARQREFPNQRNVEYISIEPEPDEIVSRDLDGNIIEFWDLSDRITDSGDITITRHFRFEARETAFLVKPEKIKPYNTSDPLYRYHTRTQEYVELTPSVVNLSREIVGEETNPYLKARAIYDWCVNEIDYLYPPNRGLRFCIPRRTGDCGSYGLIFTGLCRAAGIPARMANGHWCCGQKKNYHVWAEFFLPGYGWLPADPTDGRITRDEPGKLSGQGDAFYFFGGLDSGRFISSKGTSIQLYPSPPWHRWGLADTNNNPIFFQTAASVFSGIEIEKQTITMEIIKGDDLLW